jgi:pilus assembly protein TadC
MDVSKFDSTQKTTSVAPGKSTGLYKKRNTPNMLLVLSCLVFITMKISCSVVVHVIPGKSYS